MNNLKTLFITNPKDFHADIPGGVQLCSLEFYKVIQSIFQEVIVFDVEISRKLSYRIKRKLKIDSYDLYDFGRYKSQLINVIRTNDIDTVFVNKAELIKLSGILKEFNNKIKIVLMSHGNETGDYLHELTHPKLQRNKSGLILKKFRLGLNLYTESYYRHKYIDLVCAISLEEEAIEKWLGSKQVFYFPRLITPNFLPHKPIKGRIGFVGTLTHIPNLLALQQICEHLINNCIDCDFIIVGNGEKEGSNLARKYHFVKYLGKLTNKELENEVCSWSYFLNPIFWYSRGASMKLAQAISWNIPVISTVAGSRGYSFKNIFLNLTPNNPKDFTDELIRLMKNNQETHQAYDPKKDLFTKEDIAISLSKALSKL